MFYSLYGAIFYSSRTFRPFLFILLSCLKFLFSFVYFCFVLFFLLYFICLLSICLYCPVVLFSVLLFLLYYSA